MIQQVTIIQYEATYLDGRKCCFNTLEQAEKNLIAQNEYIVVKKELENLVAANCARFSDYSNKAIGYYKLTDGVYYTIANEDWCCNYIQWPFIDFRTNILAEVQVKGKYGSWWRRYNNLIDVSWAIDRTNYNFIIDSSKCSLDHHKIDKLMREHLCLIKQ